MGKEGEIGNSVKVDQWKENMEECNISGTTNKLIKVKCEKVIKRKDIIEKFHAIRHACKALEHLNKRYKSKYLANNYIRVHEVSSSINLLVYGI